MAGYPPPYPPPVPPPWFDPRTQRRMMRDQMRAQRDAIRAQRDQIRYQMRGLRRSSVLGPILLIAVGVLFLLIQTGRIDYRHFWEWYGHWWPLLLVAAGAVLLAEWTFDQFRLHDPTQPRYRRSMGGGIFTLLFIFGVAGFIASNIGNIPPGSSKLFGGFHIDQDSLDEFFGDKHESDQTLDIAFPANGSLAIVNPRGDVTVSGTSDDGRIHIAVHKQVYTRSDSEADSKAQQFTPIIATDGSAVSIAMPPLDGARGDLVLTVPATAATSVTANRGDIHLNSIKAPVAVTANHGDIELSAITGSASAHINSGSASISARSMGSGVSIAGRAQDITLSGVNGPVSMSGDFYGTTHLEHIGGAIQFHTSRTDIQFARLDGETEISGSGISADQVFGPVVLTTSNRNITLERIAGDIAVTNRNGTIDLTAAAPLGSVTLEDRNAAVKLTLPEHASFSIQANTSNGDIETEFPFASSDNRGDSSRGDTRNSGRDSRESINGTVGAGGPLIHITTTNNDISIHKGDVPPLPPTPPAPPRLTLVPRVAKAHNQ